MSCLVLKYRNNWQKSKNLTNKLAIPSSLKSTQSFSRKGARSSAEQSCAWTCTTFLEINPLQAYCCLSCPTCKTWSRWFTDSLNKLVLAVGSPLSECTHLKNVPKMNRSLLYFCSIAFDIHRVVCFCLGFFAFCVFLIKAWTASRAIAPCSSSCAPKHTQEGNSEAHSSRDAEGHGHSI